LSKKIAIYSPWYFAVSYSRKVINYSWLNDLGCSIYDSSPLSSLIAATKAYDLTLNFSSLTIMFSLPDDQALLLNVLKEKTASSINISFIS